MLFLLHVIVDNKICHALCSSFMRNPTPIPPVHSHTSPTAHNHNACQIKCSKDGRLVDRGGERGTHSVDARRGGGVMLGGPTDR